MVTIQSQRVAEVPAERADAHDATIALCAASFAWSTTGAQGTVPEETHAKSREWYSAARDPPALWL